LLLLFTGGLSASVLSDLRKAMVNSAPFIAEFKQEMVENGQIDLVESGFFLYDSPKRMKWEYRDPEVKIFILDDHQVKFYNPQEKQLRIGDVKRQKNQWLWQILLDNQAAIEVVENSELRSLTYRQKDDEMVFTVFLGLNGLPERVVQLDSLGYEYRYWFSGYRLQCHVKQSDFKLILPEGVDIIELE